MSFNISFLNLLFISLIIAINTQDDAVKEMKLGELNYGSISNSQNFVYYKIEIPKNFTQKKKIDAATIGGEFKDDFQFLVIKLDPNVELDIEEKISSDPNLFVSYNEPHPSEQNYQWKSLKSGAEVISIDNEFLEPGRIFYLAVNCLKKCNFILKSQLYISYEIYEGAVYSLEMEKDSYAKIIFTSRSEYQSLVFSSIGKSSKPFRVFMSEKNPSAFNTFESTPIYTNGYRFSILNNTASYKTNTSYQVLLENKNFDQKISFWLKYNDEDIELDTSDPFYDSLSVDEKNCYFVPIPEGKLNKEFIISSTIFNGDATLYLGGWHYVTYESIHDLPKDNYYFYLNENNNIILDKYTFQKFGSYEGKVPILNFCIFSEKGSSYLIKAYFSGEEGDKKEDDLSNALLPNKILKDTLKKGKNRNYKMLHFDINRDFTLNLIYTLGNPSLYLYFCYFADCQVPENKKQNLILNGDLMESYSVFGGYQILLNKKQNKCNAISRYSTQKICDIYAIVECNGNEDCIYELTFDHSKETVTMLPRRQYTNVITENEIDKYTINFLRPVKRIIIVLNQNTGLTELMLTKYNGEVIKEYQIRKFNKDYMPNILDVKAEDIGIKMLQGSISLEVKGHSFASYTIYFYPYEEDDKETLEHKVVSMQLIKGRIFQDFFEENSSIKVYSFDNMFTDKKNLYIRLTKMNVKMGIYIFDDLDKYTIKNGKVDGFIFSSPYSNDLLIDKDSINYPNGLFYIVLVKNKERKDEKKKQTSSYYISITDDEFPLYLSEGIEHRQTLNFKHTRQNFYYSHVNLEQSLLVSITVYYGKVRAEVKISGKQYVDKSMNENNNLIEVTSKEIKELCSTIGTCNAEISVYLEKDYQYYTDFLIVAQSSKDSPIKLTPGLVSSRQILNGEYQHFIIETIPNENIGIILNIMFTKGKGDIYVRKAIKGEIIDKNVFPNETYNEYTNTQKFSENGQYITIPYNEVKDLNPCILYATIKGNFPGYSSNRIEYSISISNEIVEIMTDKNYRFSISTGQLAYFHFTVKNKKKKLYISMTNKEEDAFLFLNYGNTPPSTQKFQWKSTGANNEFLDISVEDFFFISNKRQDIDGEYQLAVQGLGDTYYNLYISSEDIKLMTITEKYPAGCSCTNKGSKCYFRYENMNDVTAGTVFPKDLIFYIEYTYGSGKIYGKLYPNGNNEEIFKDLPSEKNSEYASQGKYEFLNIKLTPNMKHYTINSVLILAVECKEPSLFDFNVVPLKQELDELTPFYFEERLRVNKDNLFYLSSKKQKEVTISYYNYRNYGMNFIAKAYKGSAKISVYTNSTYYYWAQDITPGYFHIANFDVSENDLKPYYNKISKDAAYGHNIYFKIKPKDECLFYVHLHYDYVFNKLPIGKEEIAMITNGEYLAYFDYLDNFQDVLFTVTPEDKNAKNTISVYLKINLLNTHSDELYEYSFPEEENYDYKGKSKSVLNTVSILIPNIPNSVKKGRKVRVLIYVKSDRFFNDVKINLLVSPTINSQNWFKPVQKMYYYSYISGQNKKKSIFTLTKKNPDDDLLIIEISACQGEFDYLLTQDSGIADEQIEIPLEKRKITQNEKKGNLINPVIEQYFDNKVPKLELINPIVSQDSGKKILTIKDINDKEYYLSIFNEKNNNDNSSNSDEIEILFSYYTINSKYHKYSTYTPYFDYTPIKSHTIQINLPIVKVKDAYGNEENAENLIYNIILTDNSLEFQYMESTCYLSKHLDKRSKKFNKTIHYEVSINEDKTAAIVSQLNNNIYYYLNILITNLKTGEIIALQPIQVVAVDMKGNKIYIIILIVAIIFIGFIAFCFYKKYKKAKNALNYDIGNLPKSISELKNIPSVLKKAKDKYSTLTEDAGNMQ